MNNVFHCSSQVLLTANPGNENVLRKESHAVKYGKPVKHLFFKNGFYLGREICILFIYFFIISR